MINKDLFKRIYVLNAFQRTLLVIGIVAIVLIVIYFLFLWYKKALVKDKKTKMTTLSLIINYRNFIEYTKYMQENGEDFDLYLIKINNLTSLENKYSSSGVKSYLNRVIKELSIYLPFGAKISATKDKNIFIVYYPNLEENKLEVGLRFKEVIEKGFTGNNIKIIKRSSVAQINERFYVDDNLLNTLICSVRNLGEVTLYNEDIIKNSEEFYNIKEKLKLAEIIYQGQIVKKNKDENYFEKYNTITIEDLKLLDYLKTIPEVDQAWFNIDLLENLLDLLNRNNYLGYLSLPVLLNTIEKEGFISSLEQMVYNNNFHLEHVILSIKITKVNFEEKIIKNILTLINLGVKISLDVNVLNQDIYSLIQKYHIKRLEVDDLLMNDDNITELLYFAKVNNLEVIYKTNQEEMKFDNLNIDYLTKETINLKDEETQKRGYRK